MKYKTEMKVLKFMHSPKAIPTLFRGAAKALCAAATALTLYGVGYVSTGIVKACELDVYPLPFVQNFAVNSGMDLFVGVMALAGSHVALKKINKAYRRIDLYCDRVKLCKLLAKQP